MRPIEREGSHSCISSPGLPIRHKALSSKVIRASKKKAVIQIKWDTKNKR